MVIHFKSDVFTAVAVMNAKLPSTLSNLKICFLLICFHQMLPCKSFWYNKKIKKIILDHSCKHQPLCISAFQLRPFENLKMSNFPFPPRPPASWGKALTGALQHLPPPPPTILSPFYPSFFSYHFFHLLKLCLDFLRTCFHIIRLLTCTFSLKRCGSKRS